MKIICFSSLTNSTHESSSMHKSIYYTQNCLVVCWQLLCVLLFTTWFFPPSLIQKYIVQCLYTYYCFSKYAYSVRLKTTRLDTTKLLTTTATTPFPLTALSTRKSNDAIIQTRPVLEKTGTATLHRQQWIDLIYFFGHCITNTAYLQIRQWRKTLAALSSCTVLCFESSL